MTPPPDERAKGVDLPDWWLLKVGELVDERKETLGESMSTLGKKLAEAVGREEPWDHSAVSRFLRGRNTTVPMAEAFSELLGVPRPFFVPRTLEEAIALTATAKRHDARTAAQVTSSEQSRRLAEVDAVLERETRAARLDRPDGEAEDRSLHGKSESGERARRASRRRTPPARS